MTHVQKVDVAILGAGTAGLTARREVARHTDRYVVIDPGPLGTTCARVGCMPSKSFIHAANVYHQVSRAPRGLNVGPVAPIDLPEVMSHVRELRDFYTASVIQGMEDWRDSHLITKRARFLDPHTLDLEGDRLTADRIVIATGSKPFIPESWRRFDAYLLDTDRFFDLPDLPPRLAVIGLGPVGIELAQAMQRLGVEITAVDAHRNLGGLTDPEIQDYAIEYFSNAMNLWIGTANLKEAEGDRIVVQAGDREVKVNRVLAAMGRQPTVSDLGLENLEIPLDDRGLPQFNPETLQISNLPIFLAGDVNGRRPVLHEASDEGRIAGYNALQDSPDCFHRRAPMAITFTSPTIALVGATFRELKEQGTDFVTGKVSFEHQGRARLMNAAHGLLKVYAAHHDGRVLGAEMFSPGGEHFAHLLAWAIAMKMTVTDLLNMPYYHPVLEEGLRTAVRDAASQLEVPASYTQTMRCEDNPVL
ncbi:dihydrolipoyl dehydrogenase [Methylohalobius crimeensis]|uniref:dihydrolipoyl dehydrogenase n=1 Tax=Methylohalobius crimeensis TaxID=244365 RepID=UPI0003B513DD|nr:dihydrolipoyl dehydrogenase [Methylohalobius crimeensis]